MNLNTLATFAPRGHPLSLPANSLRVLGIDLGTTNSTVAEIRWKPGQEEIDVRCLEVEQDTPFGAYTHVLVPSAVALMGEKSYIGEGAKRLLARATELGLERDKSLFLECKNDMGVQRTYHRAPPGHRCAAEIGGKVLGFIREAAAAADTPAVDRTVVTVPASFQAPQRLDTIKAAALGGITLSGGDLLDEPMAAFLDFLLTHPDAVLGKLDEPRNVLVFDFGGGTCDVAVFRLGRNTETGLTVAPLAVSRYHRLGGGDIDRAIVYEVLLPQLLEQNHLGVFDLSFEDKKNSLEPALLGLAEALKIGLCSEIFRMSAFGQYDAADKEKVIKKQPGQHVCLVKDRRLTLQSPSLSAKQFEALLAPFLDRTLLFARETEYRLTCSIFAPIRDALDQAQIETSSIDFCLLVGGSSLIPQIGTAVAGFFPTGKLLTFGSREEVQLAIARGAAWHAFARTIFGRGIFDIIAHERISIGTSAGSHELIPKGTALPFPGPNEWATSLGLAVQESSFPEPVKLLVEIRGGEPGSERKLYAETWIIDTPVAEGDRLRLDYQIDENQVLNFRLTLADATDATPFSGHVDNPFTNVVNPHATRIRIQQAEEALRTGKIAQGKITEEIVGIARDYAELRMHEKAISFLERALRMKNEPAPEILNLLGMYYGETGNAAMEEKLYRECARTSNWAAPLFNLALAQKNRGQFEEASVTVASCLERRQDGPTYTLQAIVFEARGSSTERDDALQRAMRLFAGVRAMSDWELGWYLTASQLTGEKEKIDAARDEQRRRARIAGKQPEASGLLPNSVEGSQ